MIFLPLFFAEYLAILTTCSKKLYNTNDTLKVSIRLIRLAKTKIAELCKVGKRVPLLYLERSVIDFSTEIARQDSKPQ